MLDLEKFLALELGDLLGSYYRGRTWLVIAVEGDIDQRMVTLEECTRSDGGGEKERLICQWGEGKLVDERHTPYGDMSEQPNHPDFSVYPEDISILAGKWLIAGKLSEEDVERLRKAASASGDHLLDVYNNH